MKIRWCERMRLQRQFLKQASHWHDKRYATSRNLACQWRKNSSQSAWRCVAMRIRWSSACHVVAKILKCSQIVFQGVMTCHDFTWIYYKRRCTLQKESYHNSILSIWHTSWGCHVSREQFVTYAWQMARHGAHYAWPCRLDRLRVTKMTRLGAPYCEALREQNSCQCEACFTHAVIAWVGIQRFC